MDFSARQWEAVAMQSLTDVAVIGSGFGGSVAALRAMKAGQRVIVLEQGRRLSPADLERGATRTRSLLWEPALGLAGYFRQTALRDVVIVGGVGVGGGSMVYAAVLLEPKQQAFDNAAWRRSGPDWYAELAPHYRTAAQMLGRQVNPNVGVQDIWLRESANLLGAGDTYGPTPAGHRLRAVRRLQPVHHGLPHTAPNTLDRLLLARAEELGAEIQQQ